MEESLQAKLDAIERRQLQTDTKIDELRSMLAQLLNSRHKSQPTGATDDKSKDETPNPKKQVSSIASSKLLKPKHSVRFIGKNSERICQQVLNALIHKIEKQATKMKSFNITSEEKEVENVNEPVVDHNLNEMKSIETNIIGEIEKKLANHQNSMQQKLTEFSTKYSKNQTNFVKNINENFSKLEKNGNELQIYLQSLEAEQTKQIQTLKNAMNNNIAATNDKIISVKKYITAVLAKNNGMVNDQYKKVAKLVNHHSNAIQKQSQNFIKETMEQNSKQIQNECKHCIESNLVQTKSEITSTLHDMEQKIIMDQKKLISELPDPASLIQSLFKKQNEQMLKNLSLHLQKFHEILQPFLMILTEINSEVRIKLNCIEVEMQNICRVNTKLRSLQTDLRNIETKAYDTMLKTIQKDYIDIFLNRLQNLEMFHSLKKVKTLEQKSILIEQQLQKNSEILTVVSSLTKNYDKRYMDSMNKNQMDSSNNAKLLLSLNKGYKQTLSIAWQNLKIQIEALIKDINKKQNSFFSMIVKENQRDIAQKMEELKNMLLQQTNMNMNMNMNMDWNR